MDDRKIPAVGCEPERLPDHVEDYRFRRRIHKALPTYCAFCDREREAGNDHHPSHDASEHCKSGKHSHCSCDACF